MKAVVGGIAIMVAISAIAAFGLDATFSQSASDAFVSEYNSVRLD